MASVFQSSADGKQSSVSIEMSIPFSPSERRLVCEVSRTKADEAQEAANACRTMIRTVSKVTEVLENRSKYYKQKAEANTSLLSASYYGDLHNRYSTNISTLNIRKNNLKAAAEKADDVAEEARSMGKLLDREIDERTKKKKLKEIGNYKNRANEACIAAFSEEYVALYAIRRMWEGVRCDEDMMKSGSIFNESFQQPNKLSNTAIFNICSLVVGGGILASLAFSAVRSRYFYSVFIPGALVFGYSSIYWCIRICKYLKFRSQITTLMTLSPDGRNNFVLFLIDRIKLVEHFLDKYNAPLPSLYDVLGSNCW